MLEIEISPSTLGSALDNMADPRIESVSCDNSIDPEGRKLNHYSLQLNYQDPILRLKIEVFYFVDDFVLGITHLPEYQDPLLITPQVASNLDTWCLKNFPDLDFRFGINGYGQMQLGLKKGTYRMNTYDVEGWISMFINFVPKFTREIKSEIG